MGEDGGPHNARYTPVNNPTLDGWFNADNVVLEDAGTCSDTVFNNEQQACLDAGETWTQGSGANPTTPAPGLRNDFSGTKLIRKDSDDDEKARNIKKSLSPIMPKDVDYIPGRPVDKGINWIVEEYLD